MEISSAKYFSLIIDWTPDISHVDQLTFVIRYALPNGSPVERFLKYFPKTDHKSQQTGDAVTSTLSELGIVNSNCRGHSYENAANTPGIYEVRPERLPLKILFHFWITDSSEAQTLSRVGFNTQNSSYR
nr:unnamed protein product [Callosobruchus analis]